MVLFELRASFRRSRDLSRELLAVFGLALGTAPAMATPPDSMPQPRVEVLFDSPSRDLIVPGGTSIHWVLSVQVTQHGFGLAGIVADVVQSQSNPAFVDLAPASSVPPGFAAFARPLGISNPSWNQGGTPVAGYRGTQVGTPGAKNLAEIGGTQNTLGVSGVVMGTDVAVSEGVASGAYAVFAEGDYVLPSTPGQYCLELENVYATVLTTQATAPQVTWVRWVSPQVSGATLCVSVAASQCDSIDFNLDGLFPDTQDIADFVSVFGGGNCAPPNDPQCNSDIDFNNDGLYPDSCDIAELLSLFSGGPCPTC